MPRLDGRHRAKGRRRGQGCHRQSAGKPRLPGRNGKILLTACVCGTSPTRRTAACLAATAASPWPTPIIALTSNQAMHKKERIEFKHEWFDPASPEVPIRT